MRKALLLLLLLPALGLPIRALGGGSRSDLLVHEWGTFLSMQGSDGVSLDGMYHEEHALPAFVHARSRDQLRLPAAFTKGETPVIYFYSSRRERVQVTVDFPTGLWTQWYPQAALVRPGLTQAGQSPRPRNGRIHWNAELFPQAEPPAGHPAAPSDALWNHSREVDASWVRTTDPLRGRAPEVDRFLFYRGLGTAPLPLKLDAGQRLTWSYPDPATHLFVIRVEDGRGTFRYFPSLAPGQVLKDPVPGLEQSMPLARMTEHLADELSTKLIASGLYPKEARAMVNTWRQSYFATPGIRVLFVAPRSWTERTIPMTIHPKPGALVRVMVGRLEVMTVERERQALAAVRGLASTSAEERDEAYGYLRQQGRYVEPVVRRALKVATDEQTRSLCRNLLATDFVTGLRAATAAAGAAPAERLYLRAQLALTLREMGLDSEARAEAEPVLAGLKALPEPPLEKSTSRHHLRAYARAAEAAGDRPLAAERYARFIRFGSQVATRAECRGCHHASPEDGPTDMRWFRDWWAGRRYAALAAAGPPPELPKNDVAARMLRAYVEEAQGGRPALWEQLRAD